MFQAFRDYVGDNYVQADAVEEEKKLRAAFPFLLQDGESVVFSFLGRGGKGRDTFYFTDRRILERDVTGLTGTSVKYVSTPYSKIKAWAVSTAGGGFDSDSELQVWASGMKHLEIEFSKDKVDLFAVNQFLNSKVLPQEHEHKVVIPDSASPGAQFQVEVAGQTLTVTCPHNLEPGMTMMVKLPSTNPGSYTAGPSASETEMSNFLSWLGDDAKEVDAKEMEQRLKTCPAVLAPEERIELAYKSRRDYVLMSNARLFVLDVRGFTGKKVVYLSVLWRSMRAFSVETAGTYDRDSELKLHTSFEDSMKCIEIDFRKGVCDVFAVHRFLSDRLLGMDHQPSLPGVNLLAGAVDSGGGSLLAWLGDDNRQLDAAEADRTFHSDPNILQGSEHVEFAFKGRRDMVLFTTKRLLSIDVQGWSGKKKEFQSVPWSSVKAFGVRSAGSFMDKDSEMMVWTDMMFDPGPGDDPPQPGMAYHEFDFQKDKVDLMAVQRYLASRCIPLAGVPEAVPVPASATQAASAPGKVESLLSWLGNDAAQLDAADVQAHLADASILVEREVVVMAFKAGRDTCVFTNQRVLSIDVQGFSGKRVAYVSIPYTSIRAFAVESAGSFDRDAELKLHTRIYWGLNEFRQDFRKGKADIIAIQAFLARKVLGSDASGALALEASPPEVAPAAVGGIEGFLGWLGDDAHEVDVTQVQQQLSTGTPILLPEEVVDAAFKCGRDMHVHTNRRVILVDVQGWSGKKVEYQSVPLQYCTGFAMKTAGKFDRDSEVRIYTDCALGQVNQDLRKGKANVEHVWRNLQSKLLH